MKTHRWHHTTGADTVIEARPALVFRVLALVQHVLVSAIVRLLIGHPAAALHSYRVTAAEVILHLGTVAAALIVTPLEVPVLVKDNLHTMDEHLMLEKCFNPCCLLQASHCYSDINVNK